MIALLACSKTKNHKECSAKEMYRGALFRKAFAYCERKQYNIYILSAKYGLLHPDTLIKPYEMTLNAISIKGRKIWADDIMLSLKKRNLLNQFFIMFAGKNYHEFLKLPNVKYPLANLSQGMQLQWFNKQLQKQKGFL